MSCGVSIIVRLNRRSLSLALACAIATLASGCHGPSRTGAEVHDLVLASGVHRERILRGVYPGDTGWRWTEPAFAFKLDPPPAGKAAFLEMDFTVPAELMEKGGPVTLLAKVNGAEAGRVTYKEPGRYTFAAAVSEAQLSRRPAEVEFSVDRSFMDPATSRAQGLIVVSAGFKEFEQTTEYRQAEMTKSRAGFEEVLKQRDLQVPLAQQRELMKVFHSLKVWDSLRFHNVRIIKNPLDLWMLQQIAFEIQPDFVIETGTWQGGSALYWAHTLNGLGLENARVLTVDIQVRPVRRRTLCGRSMWSSSKEARQIRRLWRRWRSV